MIAVIKGVILPRRNCQTICRMSDYVISRKKGGDVMAAVDSVYQYYLSTYGNEHSSRYDSHKKSDLKKTYNNIVKSNNESPLYKLKDDDGDVRRFAIDIKESARNIKNVIASLADEGEGIESLFRRRVAVSDREDLLTVDYIGKDGENEHTESFEMEIESLAEPQVNVGNYLRSSAHSIPEGSYSFDLSTPYNSYEFQFNVAAEDTNRDVQTKLVRLINNANIGLVSEVADGERGTSAVRIESKRTGMGEEEDSLFSIMPQSTPGSMHAMDVLGLNKVESEAKNSVFYLNGKERSSYANTFTINNAFEVNLKEASPGTKIHIGFKANADAVADNVERMTNAYNSIIDMADRYRDTEQQSNKLISDISNVARRYSGDFEKLGLTVNEDSKISVDKEQLKDAVTREDAASTFETLNSFKNELSAKADKASIDPMNYVNKVVVAYKNPGHNFSTPYISSVYSGLMVDRNL